MNFGIGFIHILIATAIAGFGHVLGIVAYAIAATSGLPGRRTGPRQWPRRADPAGGDHHRNPDCKRPRAVLLGAKFPNPEAVEAILGGVHFGFAVNGAVILLAAAIIFLFLPKKVPAAAGTPLAGAQTS